MRALAANLLLLSLVMLSCKPKAPAGEENNQQANSDSTELIESLDSFSAKGLTEVIDTIVKPEIPDDPMAWVDLVHMDPTVIIDMRYATTNNFVEEKIYECGRCYLRKGVADGVLKVHHELQKKGMSLKFFDCFRPRPFQQKLWDKVPDPRYVTNPAKGSMHNRGAAVDVTIVDANGNELDMGTGFDYFGPEAWHTYTELSDEILANRQLLKSSMEVAGFRSIRTEWWHYSYAKMKGFGLSDYLWDCENYESKN
ncbi:MAG: M15 family metallopeptidase [Bacteroidota bacterium]